jgi:hypothetical protein
MKRIVCALLLTLATSAAVAADKPLVLDVWPGKPPGDTGDGGAEKVIETKDPVDRHVSNVSRPTISVFLAGKDNTGAAVLIAPGGGYNILSWGKEAEEVAAWLNTIYPAYLLMKDKDELAPDIRVSKETPPCFFVHASNDGVKAEENSVTTYLALKKAGVAAEMHFYATGGHGFGLRPSDNPCSTWPKRCEDWLHAQGLLKTGDGK